MKFNLSEWALKNKGIILYFMLLLGIVGIMSYSKLSQSEDPPFTFKVMVVQTYWPGATAKEVSTLVTDRIEKELMTTGQYDRIMAYSRPGESLVTFLRTLYQTSGIALDGKLSFATKVTKDSPGRE